MTSKSLLSIYNDKTILCMSCFLSFPFFFSLFFHHMHIHTYSSYLVSSGRYFLSTQLSSVSQSCPVVPFHWGQLWHEKLNSHLYVSKHGRIPWFDHQGALLVAVSFTSVTKISACLTAFDFIFFNFEEVESSLLTCSPNKKILAN